MNGRGETNRKGKQMKTKTIEVKKHDWMDALLDDEMGVAKSGRRFYQVLKLIGWDLIHRGCGHWGILNHKRKEQNLMLIGKSDGDCRLEVDKKDIGGDSPMIIFHLKHCTWRKLDGNAMCLNAKGSTGVYMIFANYDMKGEEGKNVAKEFKALEDRWAQEEQRARREGVID